MADDSTTTTNTITTVPASGSVTLTAPVVSPPEPAKKDDLPPEVKKALRDANKEAETLRLKLKEFEDRDKSEAQKLLERAEAAERAAADAQKLVVQNRIALRHGLTEDEAEDMNWSGTDEEIDARARRVVERRATAPITRQDVDQGARPDPTLALNGDGIEQALRQKLGIA